LSLHSNTTTRTICQFKISTAMLLLNAWLTLKSAWNKIMGEVSLRVPYSELTPSNIRPQQVKGLSTHWTKIRPSFHPFLANNKQRLSYLSICILVSFQKTKKGTCILWDTGFDWHEMQRIAVEYKDSKYKLIQRNTNAW
jgi:hypothetical protein